MIVHTIFLVLAAAVILSPSEPRRPDKLCGQLTDLEHGCLRGSRSEPMRVDVFWLQEPDGIFPSVYCSHYGQPSAEKFCQGLIPNMSSEFPGALPLRIGNCKKLRFNPFNMRKLGSRLVRIPSQQGVRFTLQSGNAGKDATVPWLRLTLESKRP